MLTTQLQQLTTCFTSALTAILPSDHTLDLTTLLKFERPKQAGIADLACNIAMQIAKKIGQTPKSLAETLVAQLQHDDASQTMIDTIEVAGPGFINITLHTAFKATVIAEVLAHPHDFGWIASSHPEQSPESSPALSPEQSRVLVEFVSANPTGPLHVGHGRQAALGDALAQVLQTQSWQVHREFYYNDAGVQIETLALSVQARAKQITDAAFPFPEKGYHGEYINELAQRFVQQGGEVNDLEAIRVFAVAALRDEQDLDLQAFGVKFDQYYLESSLYTDGKVERAVHDLIAAGQTYEQDGALWLRTTDYGDDKDRVMRKSDGTYTYFVPDVAYHVTKFQRGFHKVINIQGSDHHGTIARVRAGLQGLNIGIPAGFPDYVLHKMVTVMRGGEEVKISKRAGSYVTLRDLIDWVGKDAVRFFLAMRKADTEFVFDVDLALRQTEENPVYYIQYAHARCCSVLTQWGGDESNLLALTQRSTSDVNVFAPLTSKYEHALMQQLAQYPAVLSHAAQELSPHHIAFYLKDLAGDFHRWYNAERFLVEDTALKLARLALLLACRSVLAQGLAVLSVSAPTRMDSKKTEE